MITEKGANDFYDKFREWLGERWEKQAGRTVVRSHQKIRSSNMQVGALAPETKNDDENAPLPGVGPWAAGADP